MRFLCLHGRGTNSDIFESQLAPLFSKISPEHTFDFIDGQFEGPAAPGIADVFPGPYFVWHQTHDPQNVEKVHDYLEAIIEEDGPYDGIIGFSEGAALAASYLLSKVYRAALGDCDQEPEDEIQLAIFFNSVKPCSPSEEIGINAAKEFHQELRRHSHFLRGESMKRRNSNISQEEAGALVERRQSMVSQRRESIIAWKNSGMPGRRTSTASTDSSSDDELDDKTQSMVWDNMFSPVFCFEPDTFPTRIQIPTLNVVGEKDQFREYSVELTKLCDPEQMEVAMLDIGHEIPRSGGELEKLVEAFELVMMMASVGGS